MRYIEIFSKSFSNSPLGVESVCYNKDNEQERGWEHERDARTQTIDSGFSFGSPKNNQSGII